MADILQALNWLNYGSSSTIQPMNRFWIDQIRDPDLTDDEKQDIIRSLAGSVSHIADPYEKAELLVNCGAYAHQLKMAGVPAEWLAQAEKLYSNDAHRQAVAVWMQYIVRRSESQFQQAVALARRARRLFTELADLHLSKKIFEVESWYRGRVIDMTSELIASPEDVFELLFEFHGSYLSASSAQLKAILADFLAGGDQARIHDVMQQLLGVSFKASMPEETGEALAYCGVIHWLFENHDEAINFFRSAMTQFIPGSHDYALLRWMLGLASFQNPAARMDGIVQMEKCIENFDCLRQDAIHSNNKFEGDLYAVYLIAMKRVLRKKISDTI